MQFIVLPLAEQSLSGPDATAGRNEGYAVVNVGAGAALAAVCDNQFAGAREYRDGDLTNVWLFDPAGPAGNGNFVIRSAFVLPGPVPAAGGAPTPVLSQGSFPQGAVQSVITKTGVVDNRDLWRILPHHDGQYRFQNVDSGQNLVIAHDQATPQRNLVSARTTAGAVPLTDKADLWQVSLLKREQAGWPSVLVQTAPNRVISFGVGTWDSDQLAALQPPLTGSSIQTMTIPRGVAVSIFPLPHLKGTPSKERLAGPDLLPAFMFADTTIGSLLVEPVAEFFTGPNFTDGDKVPFVLSAERLNSLVDEKSVLVRVRSVRVPRNLVVTLFAEENCKGEARTISDDVADITFTARSILVAAIGTRIPDDALRFGETVALEIETAGQPSGQLLTRTTAGSLAQQTRAPGRIQDFRVVRTGNGKYSNFVGFGDVISLRAGDGSLLIAGGVSKFRVARRIATAGGALGRTTSIDTLTDGDMVTLIREDKSLFTGTAGLPLVLRRTSTVSRRPLPICSQDLGPPRPVTCTIENCGSDECGTALCFLAQAAISQCNTAASLVGVCAVDVCGGAAGVLTACGVAVGGYAVCGDDFCGVAGCGLAAGAIGFCGVAGCGGAASVVTGCVVDGCGLAACVVALGVAAGCGAAACAVDSPGLLACANNACAIEACPADACVADACALDVVPLIPGI